MPEKTNFSLFLDAGTYGIESFYRYRLFFNMKKTLGIDAGPNSLGYAVISEDVNTGRKEIECAGSRIIPMDADTFDKFEKGESISRTAERRARRSMRRMYERHRLRRSRLLRVLMEMEWLPDHYVQCLDRYGNFTDDQEPKIAWQKNADGKYEFLFVESFNEMLEEFRKKHREYLQNGLKIPYDWTLYYLRKKALTTAVDKYELAWILLNFNQKRGYYQLRDDNEKEETSTKKVEYHSLKVIDIQKDTTEAKNAKPKETGYTIFFENGWTYTRSFKTEPEWKGKIIDLIVTTNIKDGNVKRVFRIPKEEDWTLLKKKTEQSIGTEKTVGAFIYDALLADPDRKIRGKLVRTIDREYYKKELEAILKKQKEFHRELKDHTLYEQCVDLLYSSNEMHRNILKKKDKDLVYLLLEDIIFYQRPLKKPPVSDCPYESRFYIDPLTGEKHVTPVKCIAKSHPLFQEFRLWQFITNLRIYQADTDITEKLFPDMASYVGLYDWLDRQETISMENLLKELHLNSKEKEYRWNYPEDKKYPGNETRSRIARYWKKAKIRPALSPDMEERLWHMLYSIATKKELESGLRKFAEKYALKEADGFVDVFSRFPRFEKAYGAYSAKAIKKLLPLMRRGKYWSEEAIDIGTRKRIEKLRSGEYDPGISDTVREKAAAMNSFSDFQGLPLWLACYVVYGRHSESAEAQRWTKPEDIDNYLHAFRQHSLRNPIVEQSVLEILRTVRDIWKQVGHIDEIHVELGRDMKNPASVRKRITERMADNEKTNFRIKTLLEAFSRPQYGMEGIRPYSSFQQTKLRIYEEVVIKRQHNLDNDIKAILKKFDEATPDEKDILRYKEWLDGKYRSPYTGESVPLARLFTPDYEIDHVIPQSRYFDDSLSNKVICESEVNKYKSACLGHEFIEKCGDGIIQLNGGGNVRILKPDEYEQLVREDYDSVKRRKLLMDDIPDDFIQRQLNDNRYISKLIKSLLSNIVREEGEMYDVSRNVITCTGVITDRLRKDWGINQVWDDIILPRFERLNNDKNLCPGEFTRERDGKPIPDLPLIYQRGFNKKRIDHRHHAMDAIVIACANRDIVNYLSQASSNGGMQTSRRDLQRSVCHREDDGNGNRVEKINLPWDRFADDVRDTLQGIIVSFKKNPRIINRTSNYFFKFVDGKKIRVRQHGDNHWAIRKPMHKETFYGKVKLTSDNDVYTVRAAPSDILSKSKDIEKITDKGIRQILLEHLKACGDNPAVAFSPEGIDRMNARMAARNTGKQHKPIYRVRIFDNNKKFPVGESGSKSRQFVTTAKGTNLFFAVYKSSTKSKNSRQEIYDRSYETIPLNKAIESLKRGHSPVPETNSKDEPLLFYLSPDDLVYLPTSEELSRGTVTEPLDRSRIYKMVSCSKEEADFIAHSVAKPIVDKKEFTSHNKMKNAITGEQIKKTCIPIKVDRLGNIVDFDPKIR